MRSPTVVMSEFDIFVSSTGKLQHPRSGNFCFEHESCEHEIYVCVQTGCFFFFFRIGVCHCVIWGGTRPGIGNKRLMGVIIRGLLPKAKLRLPALGAELIVFTQEQRFLQVSRFKALSRVSTPGLDTRATPASMWKWRNCTFLHSMQRSLSSLRNTVQVEFLYVCCGFGVPCDCCQRFTASGQCEEASYASCAGTPSYYSAPPTERCWSVRLLFTCQWTPNIAPVTVFPSSMTEQSSFEDVPFSMPGRACQDDNFVSSVDNSKPHVDPFVFLVRYAMVVWASGRIQELTAFGQEVVFQNISTRHWRDYTFLHSVSVLTVDARNIQDYCC